MRVLVVVFVCVIIQLPQNVPEDYNSFMWAYCDESSAVITQCILNRGHLMVYDEEDKTAQNIF